MNVGFRGISVLVTFREEFLTRQKITLLVPGCIEQVLESTNI